MNRLLLCLLVLVLCCSAAAGYNYDPWGSRGGYRVPMGQDYSWYGHYDWHHDGQYKSGILRDRGFKTTTIGINQGYYGQFMQRDRYAGVYAPKPSGYRYGQIGTNFGWSNSFNRRRIGMHH